MLEVYQTVADGFRETGELAPTHCDVRCAVNDLLDSLSRDGCAVSFDYSQDAAFRTVRRLLSP
jgi:hypothetical protein